MTTPRSKAVDEAIKGLYAILATVAAKKAVGRVESEQVSEADFWATKHTRWLEKAGSNATIWRYERPKVSA